MGWRRLLGVLCAVVISTLMVPGTAQTHLHHGHLILGGAAIDPGPSGWARFSIEARETTSGTSGTVTIDEQRIQIECARITDQGTEDPTNHFAVVGWRVGAQDFQLWLDTASHDPTPWFEVFTADGEGSPCDRRSLGGLAIGRGYFVITG